MLRLFVGNLPHQASELDVAQWFEAHQCKVARTNGVQVVRDRATGRSRGFAFVNLDTEEHLRPAENHKLNGQSMTGRTLTVRGANPKTLSRDYQYQPQRRDAGDVD